MARYLGWVFLGFATIGTFLGMRNENYLIVILFSGLVPLGLWALLATDPEWMAIGPHSVRLWSISHFAGGAFRHSFISLGGRRPLAV